MVELGIVLLTLGITAMALVVPLWMRGGPEAVRAAGPFLAQAALLIVLVVALVSTAQGELGSLVPVFLAVVSAVFAAFLLVRQPAAFAAPELRRLLIAVMVGALVLVGANVIFIATSGSLR